MIVTAASAAPEFDFVSRFFAPAVGINEDPVTGSAHCCLAPFWAERLGKTEMVRTRPRLAAAWSASAWPGADRVLLGGRAVTVLVGELLAG